MKIILDFDDTIFNTGDWTKELINVFKRRGFSQEEYDANYKKSKEIKGDFDADLMTDLFAELKKIDKKQIKEEILSVINKSRNFLYEDFIDFAGSFNKKDITLVSVGLREIQKAKIENTGIISFFDKISIPLKYKSDEIELVTKKYPAEKIFFIDDKAEQIDNVKKITPQVISMKMERPSGRHILPKSELADYTVKNLDEAKNIIKNLTE